MAPAEEFPNSGILVSTGGSSELQAVLHPLVLLSISDYIARHTLRSQQGPVVGGLLGQQNGREITVEYAFDVHMVEANGQIKVEPERFQHRLEQMKLVHKDRQLDFVGWYTLLPTRGPDASILNVHRFFLSNYNESAVLLAMHPDQMRGSSSSGRLPLTIYDSNWEVDAATSGGAAAGGGDDKAMDDGEARALHLRFRELNYSVETDETEMISMNYVAAGAAGATTTAGLPGAAPRDDGRRAPRSIIESSIKGKRRLVENDPYSAAGSAAEDDNDDIDDADVALTRDEEEMIATLTTKANAIQMLQARINLIRKYLASLPVEGGSARSPAAPVAPSLPILRQIQALVSRLGLVIPSDKDAFDREMLHESNDVAVVDLLDQLMQGVDQARDTGKKHAVIEGAKLQMRRAGGGGEWSIPAAFAAATGDIMMQ